MNTDDVSAQVDSSKTLPMKLVVSVVYQEKISAMLIIASGKYDSTTAAGRRAARAYSRRKMLHCATSDSSATVATARLMTAAEIQESTVQIRWPSARGRKERNAQPATNSAESTSCQRRARRTAGSISGSSR